MIKLQYILTSSYVTLSYGLRSIYSRYIIDIEVNNTLKLNKNEVYTYR